MSGALAIIVITADPARFHAALSIAAANAALGGETRLHLHADAAALLTPPIESPDDARHAAAGLPTLAQALEDALALGVAVTVCQTGLGLAGLAADSLDRRIETAGLVALLGNAGNGRVVTL